MDHSAIRGEKSIANLLNKIILIFATVILAILSVSGLMVHGHLQANLQEYMYIYRNGWDFYVLLAAFIAFLFFIKRFLVKITPLKLFLICCVVYLFAAIFLIVTVPDKIRDDAYMIYKHAVKFMHGDYEGLTDGFYIRYFPYQLGMLTYEMGLLSIWNNTKVFFVGNLVFTLLTFFFSWKSSELLYDEMVAKYTIVLSFGFLPMFFYILFAYGWVPGLFFVVLAGYFLIKHIKKMGKLYWLYCALSLGVAYVFKPNYIIAVVAVGIILFIDAIRNMDIRRFAQCLIVVIIPILINASFLQTWRWITGINFDNGHPYSLNLVMGLMPEEQGVGRRGGWYNGYNFDTFRDSGFDQEKSSEMAREKLAELKEYWTEDYGRTAEFFGLKIWTCWLDPTYQSIWCGPLEDAGQKVDNRLTHSLYTDGHVAIFAEKFMDVFMAFVYLGAFAYCILTFKKIKCREENILGLLLLVGGFLFHLISEITSQYVFVYVYGIIPFAAIAFCRIADRKNI